jgi:hypothetical protein
MISEGGAVACIVAGTSLSAFGALNKTFYAAKGGFGGALSDKKIPTWMGRLLFLVVGGAFLLLGIAALINDVS